MQQILYVTTFQYSTQKEIKRYCFNKQIPVDRPVSSRSPKTTMCDRYSGGSAYICFLVFTPLHLSTRISRLPVLTDTVTGAGGQSGRDCDWVSCALPCSLGDLSWDLSARCSRDSRLSCCCSSADVTSSPSWSSTTPESSSDDCWLLLLLACLECSIPRLGASRWTVLGSGGLGLTFWSGKWDGRTLECLGLGLGLGVTDLQCSSRHTSGRIRSRFVVEGERAQSRRAKSRRKKKNWNMRSGKIYYSSRNYLSHLCTSRKYNWYLIKSFRIYIIYIKRSNAQVSNSGKDFHFLNGSYWLAVACCTNKRLFGPLN